MGCIFTTASLAGRNRCGVLPEMRAKIECQKRGKVVMNRMEKWELAKARMYKRPALASFGYDAIYDGLQQITEESDDVSWLDDNELEDLIGDEELVYEFKMGFLDLHEKAENLQRELMEEIKTIEATYERAAAAGFYGKEADVFDRLLRGMPERMWIE